VRAAHAGVDGRCTVVRGIFDAVRAAHDVVDGIFTVVRADFDAVRAAHDGVHGMFDVVRAVHDGVDAMFAGREVLSACIAPSPKPHQRRFSRAGSAKRRCDRFYRITI